MNDKQGKASNFLQLSRDIQNTPYYKDKPFNRGAALLDLMMLTQHTEFQEYKRGELVTYKRGHCYHPIEEFATRWGWDRRKVRRFLEQMEKNGEITVHTSKRGTHIVMHKYDEWQGYGISDGISQSLENEEDEPLHGTSNGWTDGRTDGSSDSRTDSTQEIRNNNANNEQEREYERTTFNGTSMGSLSDHERNNSNQYGWDSQPRNIRHTEEDSRPTGVSEYAKAIKEASMQTLESTAE